MEKKIPDAVAILFPKFHPPLHIISKKNTYLDHLYTSWCLFLE